MTSPTWVHSGTRIPADQAQAQDVIIPAHLLQLTGNGSGGSSRSGDEEEAWQPQHSRTIPHINRWRHPGRSINREHRGAGLQRASTLPSGAATPVAHSRCPSHDEKGSHNSKRASLPASFAQRRSWRLSYVPGTTDTLALSPSIMSPNTERPVFRTSNPFDAASAVVSRSSSSRSTENPFLTRENSMTSIKTAQDDMGQACGAVEPETAHMPPSGRPGRGAMEAIADAIVPNALQNKLTNTSHQGLARHSSMKQTYEKAKTRGIKLQRDKWVQVCFEYGIYLFLIVFVYFVLIGIPLWNGAVWWLHWVVSNKFVFAGGFGITLGVALFYAFAPLLVLFEKDPPVEEMTTETKIQPNVEDCALLIPCYKSANLIAATLEAALKIFPPQQIFVLANGNSPEPLDNTEEVCRPYGVNHIWSPIGSKIVAQFVGCYAAKNYKNVLLIDDDCALPENFPIVTDRLVGNVMCIGYTIKSVGPNSSKGNLCQQAQDLEYKLSGLQRDFSGRIGSATFPHGAIALWDRQLLVKTFHEHPGFNVSEDWFFGHVARQLGSRIKMCSSIFVETETPTAVFVSSGGSRGGFGEMTIFKQRFKRWNFFFVNGMWYNMAYIFGSWKLGWWEIGAKIFVFQEVYETLLYLLTPFILPISFYVRPSFCGMLFGSTVIMYLINVIIFNEVHLRRKNERIGWVTLYVYYLPYKIILTGINVASCYWSLWKYARYFARRHPKVTEDEKAVEVVVRLEENSAASSQESQQCALGRSMTVRTVSSDSTDSKRSLDTGRPPSIPPLELNAGAPLFEPVYEPEPTYSGMSTPTRLVEGVGAVDWIARHGNDGSQCDDDAYGQTHYGYATAGLLDPRSYEDSRYSQSVNGDNDSVYSNGARVSATTWI